MDIPFFATKNLEAGDDPFTLTLDEILPANEDTVLPEQITLDGSLTLTGLEATEAEVVVEEESDGEVNMDTVSRGPKASPWDRTVN